VLPARGFRVCGTRITETAVLSHMPLDVSKYFTYKCSMVKNKTAVLSFRVRPEIKAALDKLADADRRSLASYVELVLERHIDQSAKPKKT
jgi:hypothetical protein